MSLKNNILDCMQTKTFAHNSLNELAACIAVQLEINKQEAASAIKELVDDGELFEYEQGHFAPSIELNMVKGKLAVTTKGFAFLIVQGGDDIFIPALALNDAMNNDTVLVEVIKRKVIESHKPEGKVVKIIKRGTTQIVGTFQKFNRFGYIVSDDKRFGKDVYVELNDSMNAENGDVVVATITEYKPKKNPQGYVNELIGKRSGPGNDVLALIRQFNIYEKFSNELLSEAAKLPHNISDKVRAERKDFTKLTTFTIDPDTAKDFDDAVSLEILPDGNFYLGVHIADVGQYVKKDSLLDEEAYKRGTSIYFCDRVIPMLPEIISNDLCSLNPNVDKLTLSVMMTIDKNGKVLKYEIYESIINSKYRMTYNEVFAILNGDKEVSKKYHAILDTIFAMSELSTIIENVRNDRGAINFNFPETELVLDEMGKLVDVKPREHNKAHKIIETFMVIANEVVAKKMNDLKLPFIFRVHEKPDIAKMTMFFTFINTFGIKYKCEDIENITPGDLQKILTDIEDQPYKDVISMVMLRSLKKARYLPKCLGHFGLASTYYCHFTSPIRRYPDLAIHRIIKSFLRNELSNSAKEKLIEFVDKASILSSEREKLAEDLERAVDDLKKVEYMSGFIGQEFEGIISGMSNKGFYVTLKNTCDGFVSFENMPDDYYVYDEERLTLVGKNGYFRIGERVLIEVVEANVRERRTYFLCKNKIKQ